MQLQVLQETAGAHRTRTVGTRIAALHRRLDGLEDKLRLRASLLGYPADGSSQALRNRLRRLRDHLGKHGPGRRRTDEPPTRLSPHATTHVAALPLAVKQLDHSATSSYDLLQGARSTIESARRLLRQSARRRDQSRAVSYASVDLQMRFLGTEVERVRGLSAPG